VDRSALRITLALCAAIAYAGAAHAQWTWTPQSGRFIQMDRLPKETPELQIEFARSLMLEGKYKQAYRETNKFSDFYPKSELADQNQFLRGEIRYAQGEYLTAAKEFQQVVANYPESTLFEKVIEQQYKIGDTFYDTGVKRLDDRWRLFRKRPFKRAIQVYTMVIDNQPFTDSAAQAQYKIGLCHYTRKEYDEAAFEYRKVIENYSQSDWVDEASYGLAQCYYESSLPPDYDQGPSQLTINAIDDFKVRFPSDTRVAELDTKRQEMNERIATQRLQTAKFYERRREFKAARISYEVVVEQFAGTPAASEAKQWLDEHPESNTAINISEGATKAGA
jgi:outer membrane assembly lipoprotein YfiO